MSDILLNILLVTGLVLSVTALVLIVIGFIDDLDYRARMVEYAKCADWADFDKIRELDADERY